MVLMNNLLRLSVVLVLSLLIGCAGERLRIKNDPSYTTYNPGYPGYMTETPGYGTYYNGYGPSAWSQPSYVYTGYGRYNGYRGYSSTMHMHR